MLTTLPLPLTKATMSLSPPCLVYSSLYRSLTHPCRHPTLRLCCASDGPSYLIPIYSQVREGWVEMPTWLLSLLRAIEPLITLLAPAYWLACAIAATARARFAKLLAGWGLGGGAASRTGGSGLGMYRAAASGGEEEGEEEDDDP